MFILATPLVNELFICYPPGARGDFLASVLQDKIQDNYNNYSIVPPPNYQKIHWLQDFVKIPASELNFNVKIRIRLSDVEEYLTVAHLWRDKIRDFHQYPSILRQLTLNEEYAHQLDHLFDHIVDFKNLYDVDYIEQLYKTIHHRDLDPAVKDKIKSNISIQPWASLDINYKL